MLMRLEVLPPPFSSSIFPDLTGNQIATLKGILRSGSKPCFWCGRTISCKKKTLTIDHIVPQSKGGGFGIDNVVPCCGQRNVMKDSFELTEWLARVDYIANRIRALVMTSG